MIQEFSFYWNNRRWHGYFNAIARDTIIAHFEDAPIRDAVGQTLAYTRMESGLVACPVDAVVVQSHAGIYEAIQKGVESGLGKSLHLYLN